MKYRVNNFQGLRPRLAQRLLDAQQAVVAENCHLQSGSMTPIEPPSTVEETNEPGIRAVYHHEGQYLTWPAYATVCRSPISDDRFKRIYTADGIAPKIVGIVGSTRESYTLGVPRPESAPSAQTANRTWTLPKVKVFFFYEEGDGQRKDSGQIDPGYVSTAASNPSPNFDIVPPIASVRVPNYAIPPKVTASASSALVLYIEQLDASNVSLGVCYTPNSRYVSNNTLAVNGFTITLAAMVQRTINNVVYTEASLLYDGAAWTSTSAAADVVKSERYYLYTYVTRFGEEGAPSPVSTLIAINSNQNATVSGFSGPPPDSNVEYIRIYRTVTGTSGVATYRYVADVFVGSSSYSDQRGDTHTGEELQSTGWDAPPLDLSGIKMHPGGFMVGYAASTPRTIRFSVPNHPHAWRPADALTVDYDIVGFGIAGNSIVVLTTGTPYLLTGSSPDSMSKVSIPVMQSCSNAAGIVEHESIVLYPSPDGLVAVDGGSARIITGDYYSREQWQLLQPETMLGGIYDNRYHGFSAGGNLIFGLTEGKSAITTTTVAATAIYNDLERDLLVLASGSKIMTWRTGSGAMTARWRGRLIDLQRPWDFSVARVTATGYPVKLLLYMDGQIVYDEAIDDDVAFRLPVFGDAKNWQMEIQTQHTVEEVILSTSMSEL